MSAADQRPIGSGFGHRTTASEVLDGVDLSGRNYIVTGGYSGIGIETVRALVAADGQVTVPARSAERARQALADLPQVEVAQMDLADIASVRAFAAAYVESGRRLHGLINNAGVMASPLVRVGPGWESQFAICHLGHFELTRVLEPALKAAGGARVIALSSTAHAMSDVHWDDPHFLSHDYDKWQAYGQAKTADALFALGLDRRWADDGVRAFSVHPGGIFTPLQRHLADEEMVALGWKNPDGSLPERVAALFKTPEQGASTTLWALTSARLDGMGGLYCEDCDVARLADEKSQRWHHVRPWACSEEGADRLWAMSEAMIAQA
ncbi:MAG TPA: oxidoreductase [Allosphingosinicella sp.]|jgi:NAD(P)-dependent dehydrogenase (short-subunit alcohol dehydrogenase family)|nr:oxidoreductase [Allosphingosinicella sp.]